MTQRFSIMCIEPRPIAVIATDEPGKRPLICDSSCNSILNFVLSPWPRTGTTASFIGAHSTFIRWTLNLPRKHLSAVRSVAESTSKRSGGIEMRGAIMFQQSQAHGNPRFLFCSDVLRSHPGPRKRQAKGTARAQPLLFAPRAIRSRQGESRSRAALCGPAQRVLVKDAGILVELKALGGEGSTDNGQIGGRFLANRPDHLLTTRA